MRQAPTQIAAVARRSFMTITPCSLQQTARVGLRRSRAPRRSQNPSGPDTSAMVNDNPHDGERRNKPAPDVLNQRSALNLRPAPRFIRDRARRQPASRSGPGFASSPASCGPLHNERATRLSRTRVVAKSTSPRRMRPAAIDLRAVGEFRGDLRGDRPEAIRSH